MRAFIELVHRPGGVAADYVRGRRRSLSNPIRYCIIAGVVLLLANGLSDLIVGHSIDMIETMNVPEDVREMTERQRPIMEFYADYLSLLTILTLPGLAVLLRVCVRGAGRTVMEHYVFSLFVYGQTVICQVMLQFAVLHSSRRMHDPHLVRASDRGRGGAFGIARRSEASVVRSVCQVFDRPSPALRCPDARPTRHPAR